MAGVVIFNLQKETRQRDNVLGIWQNVLRRMSYLLERCKTIELDINFVIGLIILNMAFRLICILDDKGKYRLISVQSRNNDIIVISHSYQKDE